MSEPSSIADIYLRKKSRSEIQHAIDLQAQLTRTQADLAEAIELLESVDRCERVTSSTLVKIGTFITRMEVK